MNDREAVTGVDFIPEDVRQVMERLRQRGFEVWLVGGALRDRLLGLSPKDWDLATNAQPQQVMQLFPQVIPVGVRHGTVTVHTRQRDIEVTSTAASGLPGILVDLSRRDFTVNALALSYPAGELLDPHDGAGDLRRLVLRGVQDAGARFREDPLRTLRAGRFASVHGFAIHDETFEALKREAGGLAGVASERVREEMFKLLLGKHFLIAFECMQRGGVIARILPELMAPCETDQGSGSDVVRHTMMAVHHSPYRLSVRLAALFHDLAQLHTAERHDADVPSHTLEHERFAEASATMAEAIMTRWRMAHRHIRDVVLLVRNQVPEGVDVWSDAAVRRLLTRVGPGLVEDLLDLACADLRAQENSSPALSAIDALRVRVREQLEAHPPLTMKDLAVSGKDVMLALGLKPGPRVGEILRNLHQRVLDDPTLNRRKILMDFLRKEYDNGADQAACTTGMRNSMRRIDSC